MLLKTLQGPANKCPPPHPHPTPHPPSHPTASQPEWGQTAESQRSHRGLSPGLATLGIATHKWRARGQRRDGVASVASGWVNTHDPRPPLALQPGVQTAEPQKYPEKLPLCKNNSGLTGLDGRPTWSVSLHETGMWTRQHGADTRSPDQPKTTSEPVHPQVACLE